MQHQSLDKLIYFNALFCLGLHREGLSKEYKGQVYVRDKKARLLSTRRRAFIALRGGRTLRRSPKAPCSYHAHKIMIPSKIRQGKYNSRLPSLGLSYGFFLYLASSSDDKVYDHLVGPTRMLAMSYSRCIRDILALFMYEPSQWDAWDRTKYETSVQLIEARHPKLAAKLWKVVLKSSRLNKLQEKALKLKKQAMIEEACSINLYLLHDRVAAYLWEQVSTLTKAHFPTLTAELITSSPPRIDSNIGDLFESILLKNQEITPQTIVEEYCKLTKLTKQQLLENFMSSEESHHRQFAIHAGGSTETALGLLDKDPVVRTAAQLARNNQLKSTFSSY